MLYEVITPAEDLLHGVRNLADAGPVAGRLDTETEEIFAPIFACLGDGGKSLAAGHLVARCAHLLQAGA